LYLGVKFFKKTKNNQTQRSRIKSFSKRDIEPAETWYLLKKSVHSPLIQFLQVIQVVL